MALALYRKYRPKRLSELLGQETNVEILKNAAKQNRLGQAYLFYGPRGTGKCVKYNTLIADAVSGELLTAEEIYKRKEINLLTLNDHYRLQNTKPIAYVDDGVKPCFKVTTALGRSIEITASHPLLTINGWKKLSELKAGDKIGLPRTIPVFGSLEMPEHKIKVLAYLISEGSISNRHHPSIGFTNSDSLLVQDFIVAAKKFGNIKVAKYDSQGQRAPTYRCTQKELRNWINKPGKSRNSIVAFIKEMGLLGCKSASKFIPPIMFQLKKELLSVFLRVLFSGDGSIYLKTTPTIAYYSTSYKLIIQLQHLLLRFGIIARIRYKLTKLNKKLHKSWALEITHRESLKAFKNEIGFIGEKSHRLKELENHLKAVAPNPNLDTIPSAVYNLVYATKRASNKTWSDVGVALDYRAPKKAMPRFLYSPSRDKLRIYGEVLNSEEILNIAKSDVYWDEIKDISYSGNYQVYDFTVPENHNFIANDFIVHNTTTARLIAKLLNCELRHSDADFRALGEPCNECRACQEIDANNSFDVIEIDAASNRGIEEIRNLKESIRAAPAGSRFKVYIIDEAHMLTGPAFNALLKTLEEPPAHAIFILATTEYEKLPATITSRAQRFLFRKLPKTKILEKLIAIAKAEKIDIEPAALELVAAAGEGSLRDAESLLDQISTFETKIDLKTAERLTGRVGFKKVEDMAELILKNDLKGCLDYLAVFNEEGHNLVQFTKDLIHYLRKVLSLKLNPGLEKTFQSELTGEETARLKKMTSNSDVPKTIRLIKSFIRAYSEMRYSPFTMVPLEIALVENLTEKA